MGVLRGVPDGEGTGWAEKSAPYLPRPGMSYAPGLQLYNKPFGLSLSPLYKSLVLIIIHFVI